MQKLNDLSAQIAMTVGCLTVISPAIRRAPPGCARPTVLARRRGLFDLLTNCSRERNNSVTIFYKGGSRACCPHPSSSPLSLLRSYRRSIDPQPYWAPNLGPVTPSSSRLAARKPGIPRLPKALVQRLRARLKARTRERSLLAQAKAAKAARGQREVRSWPALPFSPRKA